MLHPAGHPLMSLCLMETTFLWPMAIRSIRDRLVGSLGLRAKLRKFATLLLDQRFHNFQLDPECPHSLCEMEFGVIDFSLQHF